MTANIHGLGSCHDVRKAAPWEQSCLYRLDALRTYPDLILIRAVFASQVKRRIPNMEGKTVHSSLQREDISLFVRGRICS